VLSGADGHVTTGTVTFSAGTGVAPTVAGSDSTSRPRWWRIGVRWIEIATLALLVGFFFFGRFISRSTTDLGEARPQRLIRATTLLLGGALLVAGYDLGPAATGRAFLDPPGLGTYRDLLTDSTIGRSWLAIVLLATVAATIVNGRWRAKPGFQWIGLVASLGCLFALSYAGHASATSHPNRSITIDWVHLTAVSCWFGALPFLWLLLRSRTSASTLASRAAAVSRFSWFGLGLMAIIVATGFLRAADQVSGTRSLIVTDYGKVLIAKHVLLSVILVAAAANLLILVPRMRRAQQVSVPAAAERSLRAIGHFISAELAIALCVLVAAAALTELAPADGPLAVDVAAKPATIDERATGGDLSMWLLGRLTGATTDRFTVNVALADGSPPVEMQRLIVQTSIDVNGSPVGDRFDADPLSGSPGTYVFPALRLGLKGVWTIELIARRAGVEDVSTTMQIDTTETGVQPPRLVADTWRLPRFELDGWALLIAAAVILVGGLVAIRRLPAVEPFAAAIILTMIALITAGFAVQGYRRAIPVTAGTALTNPVDDPGSIQRGQNLYAAVCLQCHGAGGVGIDNSDPDHLHAGGTNLTDHRSVEQTDGDLYWSITNGVAGTDMPAYDFALSDEQRWDLVNYLRDLQSRPVVQDEDTPEADNS
jgi:putative copper export protein/mono/diheme cytochrome c family protein